MAKDEESETRRRKVQKAGTEGVQAEALHDKARGKKRPNVLILYSDQHSAKALGCYGNPEVKTPHLDRLAQEGVLFERAYTQNPICTPSRMSFLSGQYVHNFGYYGLMGRTPERLPNLFGLFQAAGYRSGLAGKTHTPSGWLRPDLDDLADGFGYEIRINKHMYDLIEGVQGIVYNDYNVYLYEKGLLAERDDKIYHEWYAQHRHGAGQGLDARPSRLPVDDTIEAWSALRANQFIEEAVAQDQPFIYWMTVPRPHQTYVPAQEFWDLYDETRLHLPPNADDPMSGRHFSAQKQQAYFKNSQDWMSFEPKDYDAARRRVLRGYYANVSQVDDAVGRVLAQLERLGIREDTIVLYLTDHGEFAGEHGMIEKAPGIAFHCVTQIPTILSWRGTLPENVRRSALIESVDWLPTLLELCGLAAAEFTDGKSLAELICSDQSVRDYAFTENAYTKTIHSARYKLTQYLPESSRGHDFGELYDLREDPYELKNLYFESSYREVVAELRYALLLWLIRSTRNVTVNPSVVDKNGFDGDWDVGDAYIAEDGKMKNSFIRFLLDNEKFNYF